MKGWRLPTTRHGTLSMYRYCKCAHCREAMSQYLKRWRREKKDRGFENAVKQIFQETR